MREVTLLVWFLALLMFVVFPQKIEKQTWTKVADKVKISNQVIGCTSQKLKSLSGWHTLMPSLQPIKPPFRNVKWLTSSKEKQGEWGGGALAVVALGGPISRWLRPLHARASCPMLMWRAPHQPDAAPFWLEDHAAYLLVAHNITRAHEFITEDTQYAVHDIEYTSLTNERLRSIHFNANANVLVSFLQNEEGTKEEFKEVSKMKKKIFDDLWRLHQCGRTTILSERIIQRGTKITFLRKDLSATRPISVPHCYGAACLRIDLLKKAKKRDYNIMYFFYIPPYNDNRVFKKYEHYQDPLNKLIEEVLAKFKIVRAKNRQFTRILEKYRTNGSYFAIANIILKGLVKGEFDVVFSKHSEAVIKEKAMDIISTTAQIDRMLVLVPSASNLPAWSLPFRTFGSTLWSWLLATLSVYAVAWRLVAGESLGASVAAALRAFSSCGGTPQERVTVCSQRLQLAGALLASGVVVASAYQGRLYTLLTHPDKQQEINTFQQLADSGLCVGSINYIFDFTMKKLNDDTVYSGEQLKQHRRILQLPRLNISYENLAKVRDQYFLFSSEQNWNMIKGLYEYTRHFRSMEEYAFEVTTFIYARKCVTREKFIASLSVIGCVEIVPK